MGTTMFFFRWAALICSCGSRDRIQTSPLCKVFCRAAAVIVVGVHDDQHGISMDLGGPEMLLGQVQTAQQGPSNPGEPSQDVRGDKDKRHHIACGLTTW